MEQLFLHLTGERYALQMEGIARAFEDTSVQAAILSGARNKRSMSPPADPAALRRCSTSKPVTLGNLRSRRMTLGVSSILRPASWMRRLRNQDRQESKDHGRRG